MSMIVSFCAVLFPRDVLDEILDLIGSVSGWGGGGGGGVLTLPLKPVLVGMSSVAPLHTAPKHIQ